jgi:hypothetical protein
VLNLLAFPVHGLMILCDEDFIKARRHFGRRDEFYSALRTFFWAFEFQTWEDLLLSVIAQTRGVRFETHFIPTLSSWLNMIARRFAEITNKRIPRESGESVGN